MQFSKEDKTPMPHFGIHNSDYESVCFLFFENFTNYLLIFFFNYQLNYSLSAYCNNNKFLNSKLITLCKIKQVVGPFYAAWQSYSTKLTFIWVEKWDEKEGRSRKEVRAMQKENKKEKDKKRKIRNELIRVIVIITIVFKGITEDLKKLFSFFEENFILKSIL